MGVYQWHLDISIHALREEGDSTAGIMCRRPTNFYPRPPRGGRLLNFKWELLDRQISIHALREEGDSSRRLGKLRALNFYPRPPRGGRLLRSAHLIGNILFLSTPSARRATRELENRQRAGAISIHALREEGDIGHILDPDILEKFLSTPSARRATRV